MRIVVFIGILGILSCSAPKEQTLPESERWANHSANVEIIRDDFGVPHVYGKTDADAVFGLLYAQCEDDFYRVEQNYVWAIGRLAEVEGERALYSDLRARLVMTQKEAEEKYENSPQWLRKLCLAFADGVNFYLAQHPEVKPKLLTKFEPWMAMYFSEGSIGGDIERISTQKLKAFYGEKSDSSLAVLEGIYRPLQNDEHRGSNGFAISGKRTASGNAMLLINPHTSFFFRGEVHMVSEEGLNAYGAVTWGQFFVYQGFNERTGWMHTSTGTDIVDEFEETIVQEGSNYFYAYGKEKREVQSLPITLKYKENGSVKEKTFTGFRTHHGPITHANEEHWVATAMMWDPIKALEQSFTRTKKADFSSFYSMMDIRTNSSNNTVYADADGTIAYFHGNFIPKRDTTYDYALPVDGSNPQTDWQGIHALADNILVKNPSVGWIQNCNSTPFTSAGKDSPKKEDYPYYMSTYEENYRGLHAIPLLDVAENLDLDGLITLAYDPYLPGAKALMQGVIVAYDSSLNTNIALKEPVSVLKQWDFKVSKASIAMTYAQYYLRAYFSSGLLPKSTSFMQRMAYMATEAPYEERLKVFESALNQLEKDFGGTNIEYGEINRYQRINGAVKQVFYDSLESIPVGLASGAFGALASFHTLKGNNKKQYGVAGNSFVAVVEFGDRVKAKSLLAGGQNADPKSKHFDDQAQRYADCDFKTVAFYKEDVLKRAIQQYHPGKEK